jgi:hypothetical protein
MEKTKNSCFHIICLHLIHFFPILPFLFCLCFILCFIFIQPPLNFFLVFSVRIVVIFFLCRLTIISLLLCVFFPFLRFFPLDFPSYNSFFFDFTFLASLFSISYCFLITKYFRLNSYHSRGG